MGDHVTVTGLSPCGPGSPVFPPSPGHSVRGNADPPTGFLRMCGLREHGPRPHKAWPPEEPEAWKSPSPGPALRPFPSPTQPAEAGGRGNWGSSPPSSLPATSEKGSAGPPSLHPSPCDGPLAAPGTGSFYVSVSARKMSLSSDLPELILQQKPDAQNILLFLFC